MNGPPIKITAGTTFAFPFSVYTLADDGVTKTYLTDTNLTSVLFKLRTSEDRAWTSYAMTFIPGDKPTWWANFTPSQTMKFWDLVVYCVEVTKSTGEVVRELEGAVKVDV